MIFPIYFWTGPTDFSLQNDSHLFPIHIYHLCPIFWRSISHRCPVSCSFSQRFKRTSQGARRARRNCRATLGSLALLRLHRMHVFFFRDELISHGYQWWWILSNGLMDNTYHKSNGYMDINYNQPNFLNINGYQWILYQLIDISNAIESGCWLSHLNKYLASWDDHGANHHAKPLRKTCCKWGNPARGSW